MSIDTQNPISDAGFNDIETGVRVINALNIDEETLQDPRELTKLRDITKFINKNEDAEFFIRKILRKNLSGQRPIDVITGFVHLTGQKNDLIAEMDNTPFTNKKKAIKAKINEIERELKFYV